MAGNENSGGYRQPSNPAPTSGPGMLSKRTDGGAIDGMTQPTQEYTGMPYGQNKSVNDMQGAASMAGNPFPTMDITPLSALSQRPDEAVTAGNPFGAGPGLEAMRGMPNYAPSLADTIRQLAQFDASGDAELIYRQLTDNGY